MRILLVEDEKKMADALVSGLTKKGYAADAIYDGDKAFKRISLNHIDYDLVVLDLTLPGLDGIGITKAMRTENITTPILILTARDETETKVELLLCGADDYLVKPFALAELEARIQALARRPAGAEPIVYNAHDIVLNSTSNFVTVNSQQIFLTLKEFTLLEYFMKHPNNIISREELLTHLWDFNYSSLSNVIDVHVKNLRKKLWPRADKAEKILETVRGMGYRFVE